MVRESKEEMGCRGQYHSSRCVCLVQIRVLFALAVLNQFFSRVLHLYPAERVPSAGARVSYYLLLCSISDSEPRIEKYGIRLLRSGNYCVM